MIDQLKSMAVFVTVVEEKTFRGAAKKLDLSVSVISHHVSNLEKQIGAPLLYRSTRALSLTREGESFYKPAMDMVKHARKGLGLFSGSADRPLAPIRLAIPSVLCTHPIFSRITAYAKANPGIQLSIDASDTTINLLKTSFDVAIRMGRMADSELKAKRISSDERVAVISPQILDQQCPIVSPENLKERDFISFSIVTDEMNFKKDGIESGNVWGNTRISTTNIFTLKELALMGMGIAGLPFEAVRREIKAGQLIQLLPNWSLQTLDIHAVWPKNADLNPTTRAFIDFLAA